MTTLLLNGRVHSPAAPDATAIAIRDGVVAWLGSDDIGRAQYPDATVVDLEGASGRCGPNRLGYRSFRRGLCM
ncbi:hypothetical protein, partial [Mycolicibacterium sp. CBMA 361]|uniref:hypothetical protein n=1 Tax=Mycolicibacterium sp. CBMA 361 TaxID=2606610 RepID=UPI0031BBB443